MNATLRVKVIPVIEFVDTLEVFLEESVVVTVECSGLDWFAGIESTRSSFQLIYEDELINN